MARRSRTLGSADRKKLWALSRNECAFPGCLQRLVERQTDATTGFPYRHPVGEEAHIYSATGDGPRYDRNYPPEKLETYENRILLCPTHHSMIDAQRGRGYTAQQLIDMKTLHESRGESSEILSRLYTEAESAMRSYMAERMAREDRVQFRQARLEGPSVESMFVDVPFACRRTSIAAPLLEDIIREHPGDVEIPDGMVASGAAQALLNPDWKGNALIVGGPGQGKSTLLQYVSQFHRARYLGRATYVGDNQGLRPVTSIARAVIKIELRDYSEWALRHVTDGSWPSLEEFIMVHIEQHSGGKPFGIEHLATLVAKQAMLVALDGLDEVADLSHRERVADEIVDMTSRLQTDAQDLVVIVTTRPGALNSQLATSPLFPRFSLLKLGAGLRIQYLRRWTEVAQLTTERADSLQQTFQAHEDLPHIRDLASYPMQLAILLHLLQDRGLLPKQRTELYREYVKTFLDREESEHKDPLVSSEREVLMRLHAYLGWHMQTTAESRGDAGQLAAAELQRLLREYFEDQPEGRRFADQVFGSFRGRVLCLIEGESGYQFEVQSLREYFAALYLSEELNPQGRGNSRVDCLETLATRPYWLNVCRFFVGMFNQFEIRGIHESLMKLDDGASAARKVQLRILAARLLDDRSFQAQGDRIVGPVVHFIMDGGGVVLAEDGVFDDSGLALILPDEAGRIWISQARSRLESEDEDPAARASLAASLRRHERDATGMARWWGGRFHPTSTWLATACDLDIVRAGCCGEEQLSAAAKQTHVDGRWAVGQLLHAGFDGYNDEILQLAVDEFNDGAIEMAAGFRGIRSSLGDLTQACLEAMGRVQSAERKPPHPWAGSVFGSFVGSAIGPRPDEHDSASWGRRLNAIAAKWGNGWVLEQAVSWLPRSVSFDYLVGVLSSDQSAGPLLGLEAGLREHRDDPDWWQEQMPTFTPRRWLFSIICSARAATVEVLASSINVQAESLRPRDFGNLERALRAFQASPNARELELRDPFRLGRIALGVKGRWLIRCVANSGTREQIDRSLSADLSELLHAGVGETESVLTAVGTRRALPTSAFLNLRSAVPPGLTDIVRLTNPSKSDVSRILHEPSKWPADIVSRALAVGSKDLTTQTAVATIAANKSWFAGVPS